MIEQSSNYSIRTYREGDENLLPDLFNRVYSAYAGFVPRTSEYWTWCCLNRPTVEKKGICILEKAGEVIGYAVAAIETKRGRIQADVLELCYIPEEGETAAKLLVSWILDYTISRKVDQVSLDAPMTDETLRKTVKESGFGEFPHVQPLLIVLDYSQLVREIASLKKPEFAGLEEVFQIVLSDAQAFRNGSFWIQIKDNVTTVASGGTPVSTVTVNTDVKTLAHCIFGITDPLSAVLTMKMKVHPFWKLRRAVKLLSALRLNDPWYIPNGDFG